MNVYYDTSDVSNKTGLIQVGVLDEDDLSYEYNTLLVVQHEATGRLYYVQDSGCSCPTPFEDEYFGSPEMTIERMRDICPCSEGEEYGEHSLELDGNIYATTWVRSCTPFYACTNHAKFYNKGNWEVFQKVR